MTTTPSPFPPIETAISIQRRFRSRLTPKAVQEKLHMAMEIIDPQACRTAEKLFHDRAQSLITRLRGAAPSCVDVAIQRTLRRDLTLAEIDTLPERLVLLWLHDMADEFGDTPKPCLPDTDAPCSLSKRERAETPPPGYITVKEAVCRHPKLNENAIYQQLSRQQYEKGPKKLDVFHVKGRRYLDPDQVERYADEFKPRS